MARTKKLKDLKVGEKSVQEVWEESVARGLEKADANMARFVKEVMDREEAQDIVSSLNVEIAPYDEVENIRNIVLLAPDAIIREIKDALVERESRKLVMREEVERVRQGTS